MRSNKLQINELKLLVKRLVDRPNANIMALPHQQSLTNNEPELGPNVINLTPPEEVDDTISLAGSNRWFGSVLGDKSHISSEASKSNQQSRNPHEDCRDDNGSEKSGKFSSKSPNVDELEEPSQMYWNEATDDYVIINQATGPEITSSIAGAANYSGVVP